MLSVINCLLTVTVIIVEFLFIDRSMMSSCKCWIYFVNFSLVAANTGTLTLLQMISIDAIVPRFCPELYRHHHSCLFQRIHVLRYVVVACEIKLFWHNLEIISVFFSHVTTDGGYMWNRTLKLFQNYFSVYFTCNHVWNYFKIISAA